MENYDKIKGLINLFNKDDFNNITIKCISFEKTGLTIHGDGVKFPLSYKLLERFVKND